MLTSAIGLQQRPPNSTAWRTLLWGVLHGGCCGWVATVRLYEVDFKQTWQNCYCVIPGAGLRGQCIVLPSLILWCLFKTLMASALICTLKRRRWGGELAEHTFFSLHCSSWNVFCVLPIEGPQPSRHLWLKLSVCSKSPRCFALLW